MKLSLCIVTKDRPEFMPWLAWNIKKQTRQPDQIVVVDSTRVRLPGPMSEDRFDAQYLRFRHQELQVPLAELLAPLVGASATYNTGKSRNEALHWVSKDTDVVAWFDDDDWYHPQWLEWLMTYFEKGHDLVYSSPCWRVVLPRMLLMNVEEFLGIPALPASACRRDLIGDLSFKDSRTGEEVDYLKGLMMKAQKPKFIEIDPIPYMVLVHGRNTWNYDTQDIPDFYARGGQVEQMPMQAPWGLDQAMWDETLAQMYDLRKRMEEGRWAEEHQ